MGNNQRERGRGRRFITVAALVAGSAALVACDADRADDARANGGMHREPASLEAAGPASGAPGAGGTLGAGPVPFDLGAVMEQVHFAFRPSGEAGGFSGGHTTYSVDADARGVTLRAALPRDASTEEDPQRSLDSPGGMAARSAPLRLELSGISRGPGQVRAQPSGAPRVLEDGHLGVVRGEVVEHFRNLDEGLEQSWELAREPAGGGDLRVRVRASGLEYVGTTASGLHFADSATGLGFRYGHGVWIDDDGTETPVRARYVEDEIELVVPSDVVRASSYPAVLDPVISPELGMDDPVLGAWGGRGQATAASNGADYLVVWLDGSGDYSIIYGARVDGAGVVLDPDGIVISDTSSAPRMPSVASDGSDYLVVWEDVRGTTSADIYATRVTSGGTVLDPDGIALSTAPRDQLAPSVASSGSGQYLVVWADNRSLSFPGVYATRVSAGAVLDPGGWEVARGGGTPSVASNGAEYFVAWGRGGDVYGARVSSAGTVLDASALPISTAPNVQLYPSVASNGTDYLVAWSDDRNRELKWEVYAARVTSAGAVLDPDGIAVPVAPTNQWRPRVASNGTDYLLVWRQGLTSSVYDVHGARVSSAGVVLDAVPIPISAASGRQDRPVAASNGAGYLVAWEDGRSGSTDTYVGRVASDGAVLDPSGTPVGTRANAQWQPNAASNGSTYLVVWYDRRGGVSAGHLYATRLLPDGSVLDRSGILLATTISSSAWPAPAVASDGADYLVVWVDGRVSAAADLYATRVSGGGVVLDPGGIPISVRAGNNAFAPAAASNGTDYFVVWHGHPGSSGGIAGSRVTRLGAVLDAGGIAIGNAEWGRPPSVASNGSDYLVVWEDRDWSSSFARAARVSDGVVLDPAGIRLPGGAGLMGVASNGVDYLVAWGGVPFDPRSHVYGARVSSTGLLLDATAIPISTAPGAQWGPSVAASGTDYLVVWSDARSGAGEDVYGTRVRDGVVSVPEGLPFATDSRSNERFPRLASGPDDTILLTYDRFVREAPFGARRARARLIRMTGDLGDACASDGECWGGLCVDGVCCDSPCGGDPLDCQACSVAAGAPVDGVCAPTTGTTCSDGVGCTALDVCDAGTCVGAGDPCSSETTCSETGGGAFACSACPAGTSSDDGTGATACAPCGAGSYSGAGATSCLAWTDCAPGAYVRSPGTSMADRECEACALGTFSPDPNSPGCAPWRDCEAGSFVAAEGAPSSDRVCASCPAGTYSTDVNAAACDAWTDCLPGTRVSIDGSSVTDRECEACPPATFSGDANMAACAPWRDCDAGSFVAAEGAASSDRACASCPLGTYSTGVNAAGCDAWTECRAGERVTLEGSAVIDRECEACPPGTYSAAPNASACEPWSGCEPDAYESSAPSATRDRECTPCTTCAPGERELSPCGETSDAVCEPVGPDPLDAGARDGGDAAADGSTDPGGGGCGCFVVARHGASGRAGLAWVAVLALLGLRRRGRAARLSGPRPTARQ